MTEPDDTRGLTIRELVLEVRADVKQHVNNGHSNTPTRTEMFSALFIIAGLVIGILRLI